MKNTSIPRLELATAVLSTNIFVLVKKEFGLINIIGYYWAGTQVTIGYFRDIQKIFKKFISNWVQRIKQANYVLQWQNIPSKMNLEFKMNSLQDYASRGLSGSSKEYVPVLLNGPEFLWISESWPKSLATKKIQSMDTEVKNAVKVNTVVSKNL